MSKKLLIVGTTIALVVAAGAFGALTYGKSKYRTLVENINNYQIPLDEGKSATLNLVEQKEDGLLTDKFLLNFNIENNKLPIELVAKYGITSVSTKLSIKEEAINKLSSDPYIGKVIAYVTDNSSLTYNVLSDKSDFALNFKDISSDDFSLSSAYMNASISSVSKGYDPKKAYSSAGFGKLSIKGDTNASLESYKMESGYKSGYYLTQFLKSMDLENSNIGKIHLAKFEHYFNIEPLSESNTTSATNEIKFSKMNIENKGLNIKVRDFAFDVNLNNLNLSSIVELCPSLDFSNECEGKIKEVISGDNANELIMKFIGKDTNAKIALTSEINDSKLKAGVNLSFGDNFSPTNLVYTFDADASLEAKIFDNLPVLAIIAGPIKKYAADPNASVLEYHLSYKDNKFLLNGNPM